VCLVLLFRCVLWCFFCRLGCSCSGGLWFGWWFCCSVLGGSLFGRLGF